jgi:hypothetical protein
VHVYVCNDYHAIVFVFFVIMLTRYLCSQNLKLPQGVLDVVLRPDDRPGARRLLRTQSCHMQAGIAVSIPLLVQVINCHLDRYSCMCH